MSLPTDRKYTSPMNGSKPKATCSSSASPTPPRTSWATWSSSATSRSAPSWPPKTAGVVESVKAASDIYAPVAGEIVAFNEALESNPNLINESAFTAWIFKIKPDNAADADKLLDAAGYEAVANG